MSILWENWNHEKTDSVKCSTTSSLISNQEYTVSSQVAMSYDNIKSVSSSSLELRYNNIDESNHSNSSLELKCDNLGKLEVSETTSFFQKV